MSRNRLLAAIAIAAGLAGCDTLNLIQYQISEPSISAADRAVVLDAVKKAAQTAGLVDRTTASVVPETLGFFEEPVDHFPTTLGARAAGDLLVVDLSCFHPGPGKSTSFAAAEMSLSAALAHDFGSRLTSVQDPKKLVPFR